MKCIYKINWENDAKLRIKEAYAYIRNDSPQNALMVKKEILSAITGIALHPQKYAKDKYKLNNDGSYRAFELHHYRIVYRVLAKEIRILTIRHTSMEPFEY